MRNFFRQLWKILIGSRNLLPTFYKANNGIAKYYVIGTSVSLLTGSFYWYAVNSRSQTSPFLPLANLVNDYQSVETPRNAFNFIGGVVKKCTPAVVYVEIKDKKKIDPVSGLPITVSNGSGFIIRDDGLILTNAHVVITKPNALINIVTYDGAKYEATVESADLNIDLALLKIKTSKPLPIAKLGTAKDLNIGEWVIALGNPLSLSHTATVGVVSSVNRSAQELGLSNLSMKYIQTDASITFGNSGGPLLNLDGDVIGINNLRVTAGISFAIPVDYAKEFIDKHQKIKALPINHRNIEEKCIGIATFTLSSELIKYLLQEHRVIPDDVNYGIYVWKVAPNSPAHSSGIQVGDIVTHVNDVPIREVGDIYILLSKRDSDLKVNIYREGKKSELTVKPKVQDL